MSVYMDYNSSAPIDSRVLSRMVQVYEGSYGNADSRTHDFGVNARRIVENARESVASILGIENDEVFFTSGATESNNIVIQGLLDYASKMGKRHIISSSIEHKAIINTLKHMEQLGFEVDYVDPEQSGIVAPESILERVRDDTLLVCLMHVNNETGAIQPVKTIGEALKGKGTLFHVDATQSFGKLVEELRETHFDTLSMSAHKICGPQGIGALVMKKNGYKRPPIHGIMYGGQQEHGIRPGTIPVALVAGLGEACIIASAEYKENASRCQMIKQDVLDLIKRSGIRYILNGDQEHTVASTINVCFPGISSEALMLSAKQYCAISNGSACNSNSYEPSYVLKAMGITEELINSSIRLSWGAGTDPELVHESFSKLLDIAESFN